MVELVDQSYINLRQAKLFQTRHCCEKVCFVHIDEIETNVRDTNTHNKTPEVGVDSEKVPAKKVELCRCHL